MFLSPHIRSFVLVACFLTHSLSQAREQPEVHRIKQQAPPLPVIEVDDSAKFLNDLKLSPFWKVTKDKDGRYSAWCRTMCADGNHSSQDADKFLFEFFMERPLPDRKIQMTSEYIEDEFQSTLRVSVEFKKPLDATLCQGDEKASLPVYDPSFGGNSLNWHSDLAWRICAKHEIYLVLGESGNDKQRTLTWKKLPLIAAHLAGVAALPAKYSVPVHYHEFFDFIFKRPLADHVIQRIPGLQDRDIFYGCVKARSGFDFEGVNLRISHPVYCEGECTRPFERLRKAECLGVPYVDGDPLFFLIEDNAVYLRREYNKQFGTFSGDKSFEGKVEILDAKERVLFETNQQFKGWER